jgi:hypothetical protein
MAGVIMIPGIPICISTIMILSTGEQVFTLAGIHGILIHGTGLIITMITTHLSLMVITVLITMDITAGIIMDTMITIIPTGAITGVTGVIYRLITCIHQAMRELQPGNHVPQYTILI